MDYTYIKENLSKTTDNPIDFINQFERMCRAFDISFKGSDNNFITMSKLFKSITKSVICYSDDLGDDT